MLRKFYKILKNNPLNILWVILCILYPFSSRSLDLVVFMDVGQGDATLIQKGNFQILVDGGPDLSGLYSLPKYMPLDDREIEVMVLTHPHEDHIKGLLEVVKRYSVKEVWLYPVCFNNFNYDILLSSGINIKYVYSGLEFSYLNIHMEILWPKISQFEECEVGLYESWDGNINNDSVVIMLDYLNKKFLLMGDVEIPVERELLKNSSVNLSSDVIKVGHHCSKTSSSETFARTLDSQYAICSSTRVNKFGHPDRGTLKTFQNLGVHIFKTYESGDVVFR